MSKNQKPKRAKGAFEWFVDCTDEYNRKYPNEKIAANRGSDAYNDFKCEYDTLSERQKQKFILMEEQDVKRYEIEMLCYGKAKTAQCELKRPLNPYYQYCKDKRSNRVSEVAKEWKEEIPEVRIKYQDQYEENMKVYTQKKKEATKKVQN